MNDPHILGTERIGKLLVQYSIPAIYNPQNEMFRLFETKRLFSKTKCSFFYIPYPFQHYKL